LRGTVFRPRVKTSAPRRIWSPSRLSSASRGAIGLPSQLERAPGPQNQTAAEHLVYSRALNVFTPHEPAGAVAARLSVATSPHQLYLAAGWSFRHNPPQSLAKSRRHAIGLSKSRLREVRRLPAAIRRPSPRPAVSGRLGRSNHTQLTRSIPTWRTLRRSPRASIRDLHPAEDACRPAVSTSARRHGWQWNKYMHRDGHGLDRLDLPA
jgi:hypothetical protein